MNEKEPMKIDVDAAWTRFEQRSKGVEPAKLWTLQHAVQAQSDANGSKLAEARTPEASGNQERSGLGKRWRPFLAAGLVAGMAVGLLATDWGDKAMAAMLQKFRVQQLTGVAIGQDDFEKLRQALQNSGVGEQELNLEKFGTVTTSGGGQGKQLTVAEASAAIGAPVKLLPGITAEQTGPVLVIPQTQFTLKLHIEEVNRVMKRLGSSTLFPASADNQPIVATLPETVQVMEQSGQVQRTLLQMKQPLLDVPSGIDVEQVRKAVLGLPFLPDDARRKLEGAVDWRQTLFVPMAGESSKTTNISGREVVYIAGERWKTAIWLDGDRVYHLSGSYGTVEALLQDIKELIGS